MSFPIQFLPTEVVNLIAAGEVIDSIAAVVRELVENSLDAKATSISIYLWSDSWRVRVTDNGIGMKLTDLKICARPHSTSKIKSSLDLNKITSLGFRGEALHSLTQVADLEICSRSSEDEEGIGWRVGYREGAIVKQEIIALAVGTIVTVSNLFAKMPLRRQGSPKKSRQLKAVQQTIGQIALCHPQVTWRVFTEDKPWFAIAPGRSGKDILPQILNSLRQNDLKLLQTQTDKKTNIELVLGLPDRCHRPRPDWVKVAINGRIVQSPEIEQKIVALMKRNLPRDRYPVCFIRLEICPSQIDWNRHPAKAKIYLHGMEFWREQIEIAIEKALNISSVNLPSSIGDRRISKLLKASELKGKYHLNSPRETKKSNPQKIDLMPLRALAQVHNTYIIAEHSQGLWIVEQHIAHERILYEQLEDDWKLITLETPIVLSQLSAARLERLKNLNIEVESFGEDLWAIRTIPEMLSQRKDLNAASLELSQVGDLQTARVAVACRSAIRNGTPLDRSQMQNLLDRWKNTRNPATCPHGRPIYLSLEETSLSRFFRRNWVIGKSHGI